MSIGYLKVNTDIYLENNCESTDNKMENGESEEEKNEQKSCNTLKMGVKMYNESNTSEERGWVRENKTTERCSVSICDI